MDMSNQTLHVAFTSGAAMAKMDKKSLIEIILGTEQLMAPYLQAKSKAELSNLLKDQQLVGKLIANSDEEKLSYYNQLLKVLRKYDQVLHTSKIPHQSKIETTRISAAGSELIYFAATAKFIASKLELLTKKMQQYQLDTQNNYYPTFIEAQNKMNANIVAPLKQQYEKKNHQINQTILKNDISYWTYQMYPDAYFSEAVYSLIK